MPILAFNVVGEIIVCAGDLGPEPETPRVAEPIDDKLARYRARNRRFDEVRRMPGFGGYSMRPGCDVVINGEHIALTPRLFDEETTHAHR